MNLLILFCMSLAYFLRINLKRRDTIRQFFGASVKIPDAIVNRKETSGIVEFLYKKTLNFFGKSLIKTLAPKGFDIYDEKKNSENGTLKSERLDFKILDRQITSETTKYGWKNSDICNPPIYVRETIKREIDCVTGQLIVTIIKSQKKKAVFENFEGKIIASKSFLKTKRIYLK